jgi:transaldolase
MERQARRIASWGPNVYVKVPVTNTRGESSCSLIKRLSSHGIKLNVTALLTLNQVREVRDALAGGLLHPASRCSPAGSPIQGATPYR